MPILKMTSRTAYASITWIGLLFLQPTPLIAAEPPIYLCTDANGRKELSESDKGNCKLLEVPAAKTTSKSATKKVGVRLGMTMAEVRKSSWGAPNKVNRTISKSGVTEQWVYDGGYLYFTDGLLTTIQN